MSNELLHCTPEYYYVIEVYQATFPASDAQYYVQGTLKRIQVITNPERHSILSTHHHFRADGRLVVVLADYWDFPISAVCIEHTEHIGISQYI